MISIKIVGVREREYMIDEMNRQLQLPAGDIIYDERPGGGYAFPILKKAWLDPFAEGETHRIVLNDDLELCDDFINICNQIAKAQPNSIVSFFSTYFNSSYCDQEIQKLQTPYVRHDVGIFGCAIMMPKNVAIECMEFTSMNYPDIKFESRAFTEFARERGIHIITTLPGLVQHIGDESLVDQSLPIRRTTRFKKYPEADWNTKEVIELKTMTEMTRPIMRPINW